MRKITEFYSITSNSDKVSKLCHIKRDHLVNFYISLLQQYDRSPHNVARRRRTVSVACRRCAILDF